ncbi:tetratricopeptide repeat protein [Histophilus somni]|uniref:tetratricopeptide repeat protein n=1 Tax=Histophilus somni TaxID=731 RepID=UPI0000397684|nr:SEL1-like repeat protein [Histophilus somni]ACA31688.1 Sel1 domain protein repeat-containing protein [Histophilus somni 2336]THA22071.1 sel1 repeat family protein [Histophilus somni]
MNLKKSLLTALLSFGIVQSTLAETDTERFNRALQFIKQQNYSDAFPLFKQLAEQGDANAQHNLGVMYENGQSVQRNVSKAKQYYRLACDNGLNIGCQTYAKLDKKGIK